MKRLDVVHGFYARQNANFACSLYASWKSSSPPGYKYLTGHTEGQAAGPLFLRLFSCLRPSSVYRRTSYGKAWLASARQQHPLSTTVRQHSLRLGGTLLRLRECCSVMLQKSIDGIDYANIQEPPGTMMSPGALGCLEGGMAQNLTPCVIPIECVLRLLHH